MTNRRAALYRSIRTLLQALVALGPTQLATSTIGTIHDPSQKMLVLGVFTALVTFVHNLLEEKGYLPVVLKGTATAEQVAKELDAVLPLPSAIVVPPVVETPAPGPLVAPEAPVPTSALPTPPLAPPPS